MREIEDQSSEQTPSALRWMRRLTWAWGFALIPLVAFSKACPTASPWWYLHERYLSCRTANELGDFLAGAFAPLAFLWLVATVLVQAEELRAQRRELKLTRQEFGLSRSVAEETRKEIAQQAAAAKENAAYVGKQTEILGRQLDQQRRQEADNEFDALLNQLETLLSNRIEKKIRFHQGDQHIAYLLAVGTLHGERDDVLARQSQNLNENFLNHGQRLRDGTITIRQESPHDLMALRDLLRDLLAHGRAISPSNVVLARTLRLDDMYVAVDRILSTVSI